MPLSPKFAKLWGSNEVSAAMMKKIRIAILMPTMIMFARALSRVPRISRNVMDMTMRTAGRLKTPPVLRGRGDRVRDPHVERRVEERVDVAAPADRDSSHRDAVLEDQVP